MTSRSSITQRATRAGLSLAAAAVVLGILTACTAATPTPPAAPQAAGPEAAAPPPAANPSAGAAGAPAPALKLLKTSPEKGTVGTPFSISGEGLPPGRELEFVWATWDGSYVMKPTVETVQFFERKFDPKRLPFGRATADAQGRISATFTAPEDYGEIHDIYAVLDGQDVAKAGFRLVRNVTISPLQGPVGTPITIKVDGLGWKPYEGTLGVRWDNAYTGYISAVTTRGTTTGEIRAVGPTGKHVIEVGHASAAVPYLNYEQSPVAQIPNFRFDFTVTRDAGPPPATLDWPAGNLSTDGLAAAKTTMDAAPAATKNLLASVAPTSGPILSSAVVSAAGMAPNATVDLLWVTAVGNRVSPSGWSLKQLPLGKAQTGGDGSLRQSFQVPDDLGGWHAVKLVQGEKVLGEVSYFVERSLGAVSPARVKVGEQFTVQVKGIGWTELDNGFAVTYDNGYIGYACGFNSQGDATMILTATGSPGTHLIDLYPMIYQGQGKPPWAYQMPILSYNQDAPGLTLGYRL
ncbi:MAG: hypothetical protein AAB289_08620, partial [Chloroflexota bacterium]